MRDDHFTGGPLNRLDMEFDALYYGAAHENRRRQRDWERRVHEGLVEVTYDEETGKTTYSEPQPVMLDTTEWIRFMHLVVDAAVGDGSSNPMKAVNFKLDVYRALSTLLPSHRACFVHLMDGYTDQEVAQLMGGRHGHWQESSVRSARKKANRAVRQIDNEGQTESPVPCSVAAQVEREIGRIRGGRAAA